MNGFVEKSSLDYARLHVKLVDGEPKVEWEPKVNRWTGAEIQAVLKGAERLDGEWKSVEGATAAEKAAMRFFKVVVEVQEGRGSPGGLALPGGALGDRALPLCGSPHLAARAGRAPYRNGRDARWPSCG